MKKTSKLLKLIRKQMTTNTFKIIQDEKNNKENFKMKTSSNFHYLVRGYKDPSFVATCRMNIANMSINSLIEFTSFDTFAIDLSVPKPHNFLHSSKAFFAQFSPYLLALWPPFSTFSNSFTLTSRNWLVAVTSSIGNGTLASVAWATWLDLETLE